MRRPVKFCSGCASNKHRHTSRAGAMIHIAKQRERADCINGHLLVPFRCRSNRRLWHIGHRREEESGFAKRFPELVQPLVGVQSGVVGVRGVLDGTPNQPQ